MIFCGRLLEPECSPRGHPRGHALGARTFIPARTGIHLARAVPQPVCNVIRYKPAWGDGLSSWRR